MATILKAGLQTQPAPRPAAPAVLPPIRYAAMAAAAVAPPPHPTPSSLAAAVASIPSTPAATAPSHPPQPASTAPSILPAYIPQTPAHEHSIATSSPSLTQLSVTSPMLSSAASVSQQPDGSFYSGEESPAMSDATSSSEHKAGVPQSPLRDAPVRQGALGAFGYVHGRLIIASSAQMPLFLPLWSRAFNRRA